MAFFQQKGAQTGTAKATFAVVEPIVCEADERGRKSGSCHSDQIPLYRFCGEAGFLVACSV
ncbi:MAG TPA: hypothetical protein DEW35_01125 [Ruminococcaceae bacterium]|nr:hypothetical protein [Oscillospiraceae bacterium]